MTPVGMYDSMGQFVHYLPPAGLCTAAADRLEGAENMGPRDTCHRGSKGTAVPQVAVQPY